MPWLRIDDGFASHPKLASLTDRQFRVWLRVLCYCARVQDPSVDEVALREIKGLEKGNVARFAELGLLDPQGQDYEVHDWCKYLPKDATNATRQARYRARRNAQRNGSPPLPDPLPSRYENEASRAGTCGARPVPSPLDQKPAAEDPAEHSSTTEHANNQPDLDELHAYYESQKAS